MQGSYQFPEYANGPPDTLDLFPGCQRNFNAGHEEAAREGGEERPLFSRYFAQRRKAIEDQNAFSRSRVQINHGREERPSPPPPIRPPEAIPAEEKRLRERVKEARGGRTRGPGGSRIHTTRVDGWRTAGAPVDGAGRLHKYGNFVNQVSWRSVVEFFREIEGNVISQFSTAPGFFFWRVCVCVCFLHTFPRCAARKVRHSPGDLAGN